MPSSDAMTPQTVGLQSSSNNNNSNNNNNNNSDTNSNEQDAVSRERKRSSIKQFNFLRKFRDEDTKVLRNLNSAQFMEVWNNYDRDGKYELSGAD